MFLVGGYSRVTYKGQGLLQIVWKSSHKRLLKNFQILQVFLIKEHCGNASFILAFRLPSKMQFINDLNFVL